VTTARDGTEVGKRSYWWNRLVAVPGAVLLVGGSAALLRWSESLAWTYVFIGVGVVVLAVVGVVVKRATEDQTETPVGLG
jgi:hypothetical protein